MTLSFRRVTWFGKTKKRRAKNSKACSLAKLCVHVRAITGAFLYWLPSISWFLCFLFLMFSAKGTRSTGHLPIRNPMAKERQTCSSVYSYTSRRNNFFKAQLVSTRLKDTPRLFLGRHTACTRITPWLIRSDLL